MAEQLDGLYLIGIAGGIGSGKTTAGKILAQLGAKLIVADKIAQEGLDQQEIQEKICQIFGETVRDPVTKRIRRDALAKEVFSSSQKLKQLEEILHPYVREIIFQKLTQWNQEAKQQGKILPVVLDVPLLLESSLHKLCHVTLFIDTPKRERIRRVRERGWSTEDLEKREKKQLSLEEKRKQADLVVENQEDISSLRDKLYRFWQTIPCSNRR